MSCTYTCSWSITRRMFPFGSYCGRKILSCCTSLKFDFLMHLKCCNLYIFLEVGLNYFQLGTTKELIPEEMWLRLVEWPGYLELVLVSAREIHRGSLLSKLGLPKNWKGRFLCQFTVTKMIPENLRRFCFGICKTISNISPLAIGVTWGMEVAQHCPGRSFVWAVITTCRWGGFMAFPQVDSGSIRIQRARWNCTLH